MEHDDYYKALVKKLKKVPKQYREIYKLILAHRQMGKILKIQRLIRKVQMQKWMMQNHASKDGFNKKNQTVYVDLQFLEPR